MNQFLETIVASICDRVQSPGCFVVAYDAGEVELIVSAGNKRVLSHVPMEASKLEEIKQAITPEKAFLEWGGDIYLVPLLDDVDNDDQQILGLCGFMRPKGTMDEEAEYDVRLMTERANLALHDRHLQNTSLIQLPLCNQKWIIFKICVPARPMTGADCWSRACVK